MAEITASKREIKFRCWDKGEEEMLSHDDIGYKDSDVWCTYNMITMPYREEDVFIFMQYTGVKDKDGVEIYEHDVLEVNNDHYFEVGRVIYDKGGFLVAFSNGHDFFKDLIDVKSEFKVIGNIYENPELLKETMHK